MKKSTLYVISDILNSVDLSNQKLYESLDILNLTSDEKDKILESLYVVVEKLEQIKRSNIQELEKHININVVESINRF